MSYVKFGRNYRLTIQSTGLNLEIGLPFTIEFDIQRNNYASTNVASIRIYNLSEHNRNNILHDQYDYSPLNILNVTLQAGYGDGPQWPVIFSGNATRAWSVREGTNFITTIEAYDGGNAYANAVSSQQFPANTPNTSVLLTLMSDLVPYGVSIGTVSNVVGSLSKGGSFSGNTVDLLREITNGNFFVDNLKANVLVPGDALTGDIVTINAQSGLLGTPIKEQQYLNFDLLFEPRLVIGSQINLQSGTAQTYNGMHQVVSIHHKGTISASVSGDAVTSLGVQAGVFNAITAQVGA